MVGKSKRRRISTPTTDQKQSRNGKGKQKSRVDDSDQVIDVYSSMIGNIKRIKRYASEILHHDRSIVELRPDGSILITPHPRQLPNEIVSLIIKHLSKQDESVYECAIVSKQFHAIANPFVWKQLNALNNKYGENFLAWISGASRQRLEMIGQHIRELRLQSSHWTDYQLVRLLPHMPHLQYLSLQEGTKITDTSFQHLPYYCPLLTTLDIGYSDLTHLSFSAIGQHCRQLRQFHWGVKKGQCPEWLAFLKKCPLERLGISSAHVPLNRDAMSAIKRFHQLTDLTITHVPVTDTTFLFMPMLTNGPPTSTTTSNISNSSNNNNNNNKNTASPSNKNKNDDHNQGTTHIPSTIPWPQLKRLILKPFTKIGNNTLLYFIETHPDLHTIHLDDALELTDTSMDGMAKSLPRLTHVSISGNKRITPNGIRRFIQDCSSPNLVSVKLFFCNQVMSHAFPELISGGGMIVTLDRKVMEKIKQRNRAMASTTTSTSTSTST